MLSVFNGVITTDAGTELHTEAGQNVKINNNIINNGTMSGDYKMSGNDFTNNGVVSSSQFYFSSGGTQALHGTGSFESNNCIIENGFNGKFKFKSSIVFSNNQSFV
jgi:hypothetical protein